MKLQMPNGSTLTLKDAPGREKFRGLSTDGYFDLDMVPDVPGVDNKALEESIRASMQARNTHLEMYAAAFLKEVGSHEASQYELVEEWGAGKIKWYFRKRE